MKRLNIHIYRILTVTMVLLLSLTARLSAQDSQLVKEVQVVRPYEPTLSDAFKINELPKVEDTLALTPTFTYHLTMRPIMVTSPLIPLPVARMVAEPLIPVSRGYAKLGFGNYASPLAEIYFASERDRKYSYGAWAKHRSSFSKINLDNDQKVNSSYNRTQVNAYGKRIFEQAVLLGEMNFNHFGYKLYGQDTISHAVFEQDPENQSQTKFNLHGGFHSTHSDSTHINYKVDAAFNHFSDRFNMNQNSLILAGNADKYFRIEKVGASFEFIHRMNSPSLSEKDNTLFTFAPWVGLFAKQWRAKAGLKVVHSSSQWGSQSHFYPIGQLSYDIISNYFIPYFEFGGYLEENHYEKILAENPWATPGINIQNTSHKLIITGGLKGNLSPKIAYNLAINFSIIDSAYFYVNSLNTVDSYFNSTFDVVYDNIRKKEFVGEITYAPSRSIKLYGLANYTIYSLDELEHPWHTPSLITQASIRYSMRDKILVRTSLYYEGKRHIMLHDGSAQQIAGIVDASLSLEYRYNRRASAFLDINNLTANRYYLWYLYPTQRLQFMLGITYAL